jgi:adenylylsulfate kinase
MTWAIWITGLPGSGKSVLARSAAAELRDRGIPVTVLELDAVRKILTPEPSYSDHEREVVYRALVGMARELTAAGVPVIVDATAHRREWRELARTVIPRFAEVQLTCPVEVCREREQARTKGNAPRQIYARAGHPGATVPGVDVAYEPALAPELIVDTVHEPTATSVARIAALAERLEGSAPSPRPTPSEGFVLWITGPPGSGKTTIASAVADRLAAHGVAGRVIDLATIQRTIGAAGHYTPWDHDVMHRALACTAKLLAEAGIPVIVDATAPRRAWREMARALIGRFAEVQLVCPREVCLSRERAVRWELDCGSWSERHPHHAAGSPDIVLDYELSLHPDLTVYTDLQTPWTSAEQVVVLARCLGPGHPRPDARGEASA